MSNNSDIIHIGWIKNLNSKGYGFIVDFFDNNEYFFHSSSIVFRPLPDVIVAFKLRPSSVYQDKLEAYSLMPPFNCKDTIVNQFNLFSDDIKTIVRLLIPSLIYKPIPAEDKVNSLLHKYGLLIKDLYEYVKNFDLLHFTETISVKTDFYYSASTRDWDINELNYISIIGQEFSELPTIYSRCKHYEDSLIEEYYHKDRIYYKNFDDYLNRISSKYESIKSTRAYGIDRDFWNNLDKASIESQIPIVRNTWIEEIRNSYSQKDHFLKLMEPLKRRFKHLVDALPCFMENGEETSYLGTPHFDIEIPYINGCIKLRTTAYMNAQGYGYELLRFFNCRKSFYEARNRRIIDSDYHAMSEFASVIKNEAKEKFENLVKSYLLLIDE